MLKNATFFGRSAVFCDFCSKNYNRRTDNNKYCLHAVVIFFSTEAPRVFENDQTTAFSTIEQCCRLDVFCFTTSLKGSRVS